MPTSISPNTLAPRFIEPHLTEEDRQKMRLNWQQMQEESQLAREAGEELPPITENIWDTTEE